MIKMALSNRHISVWEIYLILQFFVLCVHTNHLRDPGICGKPTCLAGSKFQFEPGRKYLYEYTATIDTSFDMASANTSSLHISSELEFMFITPCEGILKIASATISNSSFEENESIDDISESEPAILFYESLARYPLRFYFEDGNIKELCPYKDEIPWVLNFKKGILSAFQNTMRRLDIDHHTVETDVNGECSTLYKLDEVNGTSLIITKKKDIASCVNRYQLHSILPTTSYIFQTKYHKWTPMSSTVTCYQHVDNKIYTQVSCQEQHTFVPFYNQTNGVTTRVTFKLELLSEDYASLLEIEHNKHHDDVHKRVSLLFEHHISLKAHSGELKDSRELIKSMCKLNIEKFHPDFSELFNKFIHTSRYLSYPALTELLAQSASLCPSGRKHVLDSLPHLRSGAGLMVMRDNLLNASVPRVTERAWLLAMALFPRPETSTIASLPLLVHKRVGDNEVMLAVTSLVHSYCKHTPNCENEEAVRNITTYFEEIVSDSCEGRTDTSKGMIALKALANAGRRTLTLTKTLQKCISNRELPSDFRVSSINVHRRFPCETNKDFLLNLFLDEKYASELRIAAYLQVMKCPTYYTVKGVREMLEKEKINQVGSFVWSHLKNQMKSSMPSQVEIQAMLQDQVLTSKFNTDIRKFSHSYESSWYLNEYGLGGFVTNNVIFSEKSYIPLTITSNVTVSLFGEAVNIFEVTLDVQGLDRYVENLFWKGGILSQQTLDKTFKVLRFLRDVPTTLREKVNSLPNKIKDNIPQPKIAMSIKIFGNEVKYAVLSGKNEIDDALESLNPLKIIKKFLSGQELYIEKSLMLLDASYVTPLAVGFPLSMDVVGTAAVKLNMAGFINTTAFTANGELDLDGKLKPSVAINMVGSMNVDAYYKQTDIKLRSKLFTSTALEGSLKMRGYKYISVSLNLPLAKSEIVSAESELLIVRGDEEIPVQANGVGHLENEICSWPVLDDIFGLTFCTNFKFPNTLLLLESPLILFSGPIKFALTLEKSDPTTRKYIFEYKMVELVNKTVLSVMFETPESAIKRSLTASVDLDVNGKNLTLGLQSAQNHIQAQGFYRNMPNETSVTFALDINGMKHIDIQIALFAKEGKYGYTYEPRLWFQINNKKIAELTGSYKWVEKKSISQCDINLDFKTNRFASTIKGYVRMNEASIATNLKMEYQFENSEPQYLRVEVKLGDRSSKYVSHSYGNLQLESSAYPQINLVVALKYQRAQGHVDCSVDIFTNPFARDENEKLHIKLLFAYLKTYVGSKANMLVSVTKKAYDIDLKLSLNYTLSAGSLVTNGVVRYAPGKEIAAVLDIIHPRGSLLFFESNLKVTLPSNIQPMMLTSRIREKHPKEFEIDFIGTWFSGHNITIKGMYQDSSTYAVTSHSLKLVSRSQLFHDIHLTGKLHMSDEEYKLDGQVEYDSIKYGTVLRHFSQQSAVIETYVEIFFNTSTYSLLNIIDTIRRHAKLELHLDQYRDIQIMCRGNTNGSTINAGLELKWDANRDPTQKFVAIVESDNRGNLNYNGKVIIEYPGRMVTALLVLEHSDTDYMGTARLEWSPDEAVNIVVFAVYDIWSRGVATFRGRVTTPIQNWKTTSLNYGVWLEEQAFRSNGSISWLDHENVHLDVSGNYVLSDELTHIVFSTVLNSTIPEVNPFHTTLHHLRTGNRFDTSLHIQTAPGSTIIFKSGGLIQHHTDWSFYSGHIAFRSPFTSITSGELAGNFTSTNNRTFQGVLSFMYNDRKFVSTVKGSVKTLNESKVSFTIHTPLERYRKVTGKFGYSASRRHIIAELRANATTAIGVDLLYIYNHVSDFNIKLHLIAGFTYINNMVLIGKINDNVVDFRCGWNGLMVGGIGRSYYEKWNKFEYRGTLYLPFEGFRESGAVARFDYTDRIDIELSVAIKAKVGIKLQAMKYPEEEFGIMDNGSYVDLLDTDDGKNLTVFWRGLFVLDTIYYPTASGNLEIVQRDNLLDYIVVSTVILPFIRVDIQDYFKYLGKMTLANDLYLKTNNVLLSELTAKYQLYGTYGTRIHSILDAVGVSVNETLDVTMETHYTFESFNTQSEGDGLYNVVYKLKTPFENLDHCLIDFNYQSERNTYSSNLTVDFSDTRVLFDGILEVDYNYFETAAGLSVKSPPFVLPYSTFSLLKDFSEVEKKVLLTFKHPSDTSGAMNNFEFGADWHVDVPYFIKISGHVVTPYQKLDDLRGRIQYSRDENDERFFLETYLKLSAPSEWKLVSTIHKSNLRLTIQSPLDGFRNILVSGNLKRSEGGYVSLEGGMSVDRTVRFDGRMTTSQSVPIFLYVRLSRTDTSKELISMTLDVRKKLLGPNGYDLLAIIQFNNININLEGEQAILPEEQTVQIVITTNNQAYKKGSVKLTVKPTDTDSTSINIKGYTDTLLLVTDFEINCNVWVQGNNGRVETTLASTQTSGDFNVEWKWDYLRNMRAAVNGSYTFENETKDFSSKVFLWSPNTSFDLISIGSDVCFMKKTWWFGTNVTFMAPAANNVTFNAYLLLPYNVEELHTLYGKFHYTEDYTYLNQILKYSAPVSKRAFHSLTEMRMSKDTIDGLIILESGVNKSFFLQDTFNAKTKNDQYDVTNILKSSFIKEDLTTKLLYEKPSKSHIIKFNVFNPSSVAVIGGYMDFESVSNFYTKINCTMPFKTFPLLGMQLRTVTDQFYYHRFGQLDWQNSTTLLNYTLTKSVEVSSDRRSKNIADGILIVEFPLTTRHIGKLTYRYEELDNFLLGHSTLIYNGDAILQGNFTRQLDVTENSKDEKIKVKVENSYLPLGVNYGHYFGRDPSRNLSTDKRKAEVFILNNATAFNFTGEVGVKTSPQDTEVTLSALHSNRSLNLCASRSKNNKLQTSATLILKPNFWTASDLFFQNLDTEYSFGRKMEFNFSYPRRNFSFIGDYMLSNNELTTEVTVYSNRTQWNKAIGMGLHWYRTYGAMDHQHATLFISHPSFRKNVTLTSDIKYSSKVLLDLDAELEYSVDEHKKLVLSALVENKKPKTGKEYSLTLHGKHPASRLNFEVLSSLKSGQGVYQAYNNVSYRRSYIPLQFWNTHLKLDSPERYIEIERHSLREHSLVNAKYSKLGTMHVVNGSVAKGRTVKVDGNFNVDFINADTKLSVNLTPDSSEQFHMEGKYLDSRHALFNIWRMYEDIYVPDISFYVKLNHSRLLTSKLTWRPKIKNDIMNNMHASFNYVWNYIAETAEFWSDYMLSEASDTFDDIWYDAKPILREFIDDLRNVETLNEDVKYFKRVLNESFQSNEFYMQDIYNFYLLLEEEMSFRDKMGSLPRIFNELWEVMGETGKTIRQSILWVVETAKKGYMRAVDIFTRFMRGDMVNEVSQVVSKLAAKYDKMIKDMHVSFVNYVESLWIQASISISQYWSRTLRVIEPTFIQVIHHVETVFWKGSKKFIEFLYQRQSAILSSSFFAKDSNFSKDLDKFYKDLTKQDFVTNLKKYASLILNNMKNKYFAEIPFGNELTKVATEIYGEVEELYKLPAVNFTIQASRTLHRQMVWVYIYFDIGTKAKRLIPGLYHTAIDLSHTALENEIKNHEGKTKFIFEPEAGIIHLEQKLPMTWHSFNQTPNLEEIPEYKILMSWEQWFAPSNRTFWTLYYRYVPLLEPSNWLPPFKAQALIIGAKHFVTFDQQYYTLRGPCSFLLARDFVKDEFSLVLKYDSQGHHTIVLLFGEHTVEIDLENDVLEIENSIRQLPADLNGTYVYQEFGMATVVSKRGFILDCNLKFDVCTFTVAGWYFGKTAGLLGTIDNEPSNDFMTSDGYVENDTQKFVQSWSLDSDTCAPTSMFGLHKHVDPLTSATCDSYFASKTSQFSSCFPVVDPTPFNEMCHKSLINVETEICSSAVAYIQACLIQNIPLRTPNDCVKCSLTNGSELVEGDFIRLKDDSVPKSSDIVFIVEAKHCNRDLTGNKSIPIMVSVLSKELQAVGLTDNRYAVVAFGGTGVCDEPCNIVLNNEIFTDDKTVPQIISHLSTGNGNSDIFSALKFASKLQFRPGVSKTFILIPCTDCNPANMSLDYSVLHEVLIEKDITLHILMNNDFGLEKARMSKIFYGLDADTAYTKNDFKHLNGDKDLWRQVKLSKSMLGYCTPLALETNGTIFSAKKLENANLNTIKKFMSVFTKRIAKTAEPCPCQNCECSADSNGIDYMECFPCFYPTPLYNEISTMSLLQSFELTEDHNSDFINL